MPFTPYHLGPGLLFGLLLFRRIHFPTFIVASVILDLEPLYHLLAGNGRLHAFFHTFLGALIVSIVLAIIMKKIDEHLQPALKPARLNQDFSTSFFGAAVLGTFLHLALDSILYPDISPFFPLTQNYLYGLVPAYAVFGFCIVTAILGILVFGARFFDITLKTRNKNESHHSLPDQYGHVLSRKKSR